MGLEGLEALMIKKNDSKRKILAEIEGILDWDENNCLMENFEKLTNCRRQSDGRPALHSHSHPKRPNDETIKNDNHQKRNNKSCAHRKNSEKSHQIFVADKLPAIVAAIRNLHCFAVEYCRNTKISNFPYFPTSLIFLQ